MTNSEYRAELLWIRITEEELSYELSHVIVQNDDFLVRDDESWASYIRASNRIITDIDALRSYRQKLVRWFWYSRIGNPPVFV